MEENKPKVIIKYKDKYIEGQKAVNRKHSVTPKVDLTDWVYVDRIDPTVYPGVLQITMPDKEKFTLMASEIDIAYGEMAGILFEPDSDDT